jgi:glycosyltransferase involved in cell wall biosynthesis
VHISVVVPTFNAEDTLAEQLSALAEQDTSHEWEVVIADNGSSDRTIEVARGFADRLRLRVVDASGQQGASFARNVGAEHATGDLLLFCDADDVVQPGWINAMADGLARFDAVGGAIDQETLNSAATRGLREPLASDGLPPGLRGFWPRAVGANLGVRSDVFRAVGGFDTDFPVSQDTEFSLRLQAEKYTLGFVPESIVAYRYRQTLTENLRRGYAWGRIRPLLYRRFRSHGAPRAVGFLTFGALVVRSWWLFASRERRLRWIAKAVRTAGLVAGSVRHRTFYI